jgi:benzoyl-CoA reductase/2-hydroxyglutaryl-CoA dehydratase subunit BcrC/BadD/HgdB
VTDVQGRLILKVAIDGSDTDVGQLRTRVEALFESIE